MELLVRPLPRGGWSAVDLRVSESGGLELLEHDVGPTPEGVYGSELEYFVTVPASALLRLRELLGFPIELPLRPDGLPDAGRALVERFGDDLQMVSRYRTWLIEQDVPFTTAVL